jgi:hypothetical protein
MKMKFSIPFGGYYRYTIHGAPIVASASCRPGSCQVLLMHACFLALRVCSWPLLEVQPHKHLDIRMMMMNKCVDFEFL